MHAILRINSYDPERLRGGAGRFEEFDRLHAEQPGALGSISVDVGQGRRFVMNVWDSVDSSLAGQRVLVPHLQELLVPLMSGPSELLGAGPVVSCSWLDPTPG